MANSPQIRRDVDDGLASDKVAFPDPAAAPFGTDGETVGQPQGRLEAGSGMPAAAPLARPHAAPSGSLVSDESGRTISGEPATPAAGSAGARNWVPVRFLAIAGMVAVVILAIAIFR